MGNALKINEPLIGIFGGSGFYKFLDNVEEIELETEFGKPSGNIFLGEYKGKKVAFLARHGLGHKFPPHKIPYKANIAAFKQLGVKHIIAPCASGSLQPGIKPGDFAVCSQFVNFTHGRDDTFFHGESGVVHISSASPYCPHLQNSIFETCRELNMPVHKDKTVVVINGPRFSTAAESKFFANQGWDVVNMTQYPENILAREAEICYAGVALITDYDAGLEGHSEVKAVSSEELLKVFNENNEKIKNVLLKAIEKIDLKRYCSCREALKNAIISS